MIKDEKKFKNFEYTMLLGTFVKNLRTNIFWQSFRFLLINFKILKILFKSY